MEAIKIHVSNSSARVTQKPKHITAGMIGLPVEFDFDEEWEQLDKIAVFQAGGISRSVGVLDDQATVPPEVLAKPGLQLSIGVYGVDKDVPLGLPTIWANVGVIKPGANPVCPPSSDTGAALKIYQSAVNSANRAEDAAKEAEASLEQIEKILDAGVDTGGISCFGWRYADAEQIYDLNDEKTVKMYLFPTGDGYDAVVRYEGPEGQTGEVAGYHKYRYGSYLGGRNVIYLCTADGNYKTLNNNAFTKIEPNEAAIDWQLELGKYYTTGLGSYYKCISPTKFRGVDPDCLQRIVPELFKEGMEVKAGTYYMGDGRSFDVQKIVRLHIEEGIASIGDYFMYQAFNLKYLSFAKEDEITHLGECAFAYTQIRGEYSFSELTDATINGVFRDCRYLEGVTFNTNVKEIASSSFNRCTSLRYVDGISTVTEIGDSAFQYCCGLKSLDVTPGNVCLGNYVFMLTPNEVRVGKSDAITDSSTHLHKVVWNKAGVACFTQSYWTEAQLTAIQGYKPESIELFPIPKTDSQNADVYSKWRVFWGAQIGWKDKIPAAGQCGLFSMFHIYNLLHPNAQYDSYYDFITKEIEPKKLKVTDSLYSALREYSNFWKDLLDLNSVYKTEVSYEIGDEILVTDLPMARDYDAKTWGDEGTAFWGICEALGWKGAEVLFEDGDDSGQKVKKVMLDNMAAGKPVIMEIVGAASSVHGAHAVVPIGYDQATDKLKIIDSSNMAFASTGKIPFVYWLPFEALITPDADSCVWTFDFGEEITMTNIDGKLGDVDQASDSILDMQKFLTGDIEAAIDGIISDQENRIGGN